MKYIGVKLNILRYGYFIITERFRGVLGVVLSRAPLLRIRPTVGCNILNRFLELGGTESVLVG